MLCHRSSGRLGVSAGSNSRGADFGPGGIIGRSLRVSSIQRRDRFRHLPARAAVQTWRSVWGGEVMKFIALIVALALVIAAPWVITDPFYVHLMIMVLMWTVLGAAWNILGGFAGQVSFGHSAFLGAGAYTTMILYLSLGISPWYGIVLAGIVAALIAVPIGLICFRLRGPYFALSTLAVAEIIRLVALNWESLTNGPVGLLITTLPPVSFAGNPINWESKIPFYYIGAIIAAV